MLIGMYWLVAHVLAPRIVSFLRAIAHPTMVAVIMAAGIVMLFGAVGISISRNLGATVVGGVFRAIGFIIRTIIRALSWIVRTTFSMVPRVYRESNRTLNQAGVGSLASSLVSVLVAIMFVAIVIWTSAWGPPVVLLADSLFFLVI